MVVLLGFDQIWPRFRWVIEEMFDGMLLFEGFIPSIDDGNLEKSLDRVADASQGDLYPIWSDESSEEGLSQPGTSADYAALLRAGKLVCVHLDYDADVSGHRLKIKLIVEAAENGLGLEIICHCDAILDSINPERAIEAAIKEFRRLRRIFHGDALLIGPDTLNYPRSADDYPEEWLRIE